MLFVSILQVWQRALAKYEIQMPYCSTFLSGVVHRMCTVPCYLELPTPDNGCTAVINPCPSVAKHGLFNKQHLENYKIKLWDYSHFLNHIYKINPDRLWNWVRQKTWKLEEEIIEQMLTNIGEAKENMKRAFHSKEYFVVYKANLWKELQDILLSKRTKLYYSFLFFFFFSLLFF